MKDSELFIQAEFIQNVTHWISWFSLDEVYNPPNGWQLYNWYPYTVMYKHTDKETGSTRLKPLNRLTADPITHKLMKLMVFA